MFSKIRAELTSFSSLEKWFILFAMITGFCIAGEYGITRPASISLFVGTFTTKGFPLVWLATVPLNFLAIWLYNRFLSKIGPLKMMAAVALFSTLVNCIAALFVTTFPWAIFLQFAWKDIYILLMFKQLWSLIHSTITPHRAKYLYGVLFAVGTLGSITGSLIPGFFATWTGSESLFFLTAPVYALMLFAYRRAYFASPIASGSIIQKETEPKEGFSLVFRSQYLMAILAIVVFMQVSSGLIEYHFNTYLEQAITEIDLRTEYMGRLSSIMNLLSGVLQLVGSFLMVQLFGVRNSHLLIPAYLLLNSIAFALFPSFGMLAYSFIVLKGIDYSLFGVVREMLYIPLQLDEKFRAKAVIDVFAYRSSKALVSCGILAMQAVAGSQLLSYISGVSIAIFVLWISAAWVLLRKHRTMQAFAP